MTGIGNTEWLAECRNFAHKTDSYESFRECLHRVMDLGKNTGYAYHRPMFQKDPTMIEFNAGGLYGGIVYHESENKWSIHT